MNGWIRSRPILLALAFLAVSGPSAGAQQDAPDVAVAVNEGVYLYLRGVGAGDVDELRAAAEKFGEVLEAAPDHRAALLFRALSHGAIGLEYREETSAASGRVYAFQKLIEVRGDPESRARLVAEREDVESELASESLPAERRVALQDRLAFLDTLTSQLERFEGRSEEDLADDLAAARAAKHESGSKERDAYRLMAADLNRLIGLLDSPETIVRLLDVVANAKIARLDEEEAAAVLKKEIPAVDASAKPAALRAEAAAILDRAAAGLEAVLEAGASEENSVRTRFFLGVVRFRQALPEYLPSGSSEPDMVRFAQARAIFEDIADEPSVEREWRSYAALYLGLILPFEAAQELDDPAARTRLLDAADARLAQASELDAEQLDDPETGEPDPTRVRSASGAIPGIVWRQRDHIGELREGAPRAARPRRDIYLNLSAGAHRDTNVVLLGERTDLPRDVSRSKDFGFTGGVALGYTHDFDEKWTLGIEGRVTQLWHADVDQFDEQDYGGSAALQYEAVGKQGDFGPVLLRLQYDYTYTLLGRSAFLASHSLTPNLRLYWADYRAETDLYYRYEIRDYAEPLYDRRFNRSGEYHALGVTQKFHTIDMAAAYTAAGIEPWGHPGDASFIQDDPDYPKRYLTPYVGFEYGWDQTDGEEFDQKSCVLSFGVSVPLPLGLVFDGGASFEWQDYRHAGSLVDYHRRPRRDLVQRYEVALSRTFVLRAGRLENRYGPMIDRVLMTLRAHATWTLDDSNVKDRYGQAIFEYDRTVYGLSVAFSLN